VRIFCGHFVLEIMESFALNSVFNLALMWIVHARQQCPERRPRGFANEPARCVASELDDARLEAAKPEFLVGIVRVDLAQNVSITLWLADGLSVRSMDFENRFNDLRNWIIMKSFS
jgi:hypothetical protein